MADKINEINHLILSQNGRKSKLRAAGAGLVLTSRAYPPL